MSLSAAGSGNLPVQLTRFYGREAEIAELERLVAPTRLVTLAGPPGAGKSRLGLEVARRLTPGFADGAWLVDLSPVCDPEPVAAAVGVVVGASVGAAAGAAEGHTGSAADALATALADRELLLVLDNCEHVAAGTAETVSRVIADCPGVRLLATSRLPLGLPGEQVWPVAPLAEDPAVDLFVDRARLASSDFRVDGATRSPIHQICDRLDGLPLAIELAAAWTRVLSPGQIVERLDDALPLLAPSGRAPAPRQATMEATVDWSHRLLGPGEQRVFSRLSVFPTSFDLAAAESVAGPDADALAGVTTLVDHSLLQAEPAEGEAMRYRMLEPVRQYGAARLSADAEEPAVRRRHAHHFLDRARRLDGALRGDGRTAAIRALEREEPNFHAALDWALGEGSDVGLRLGAALAQSWEVRGSVHAHRAYMDALLQIDTPDRRLRSTILARAARLAWRQQDHARARDLLEQSLAAVRAYGDDLAVARRLRSMSLVAVFDGDLEAASDLGERSVALCRAHGDRRGLALGQIAIGWARYLQGDVAEGDDRMADALSISRELGFGPGTVFGLQGLTSGAQLAGDTAAARRYLVDQLAAIRQAGTARSELSWQWSGAVLAADEGRYEAALHLVGGAEALGHRRGTELEDRLRSLTRLQPRLDRAADALGPAETDRLVAEGARMSVDALMAEACAEAGPGEAGDGPLSPREREVVDLVGEGLTNGQIAEALFISKRTVESHVDHIKQKLGHASRSQVIAWAVRRAGAGGGAGGGAAAAGS